MARAYWARAGLEDRIELRLAPAAETLAALPRDPPIDLAFVDADKEGYPTYLDLLAERLRPGGVIAVDNTLWSGAVADPAVDGPDDQPPPPTSTTTWWTTTASTRSCFRSVTGSRSCAER